MHFDDYIAYWASTRPDEPYMSFEHRVLSWRELDAQAGALAAHLKTLGVERGDRVGCLLPNCLEWCVCFAAAIRAGAIMVPLNIMFGRYEIKQIARNADCAALLSIPSEVEKVGLLDDGADRVRCYDLRGGGAAIDFDAIVGGGIIAPRAEGSAEDILAICYTSGTTGVPKGIMLSHRAVETMATRVAQFMGWRFGEERLLIVAPLAFTGGIISNLAAQFQIGASGWLCRGVEPSQALEMIVDYRISFLGGVPALWERIAEAPAFVEADLSAMRSAGTGGAPVPVPLLRRYADKGVVIRQQFGCSENCGTITCPNEEEALARPHACGRPVPGVRVEIRDDGGLPVPQGTVGEICILSDQIMSGYWRLPDETAAAFNGLWYKTGDLGYFDEHGGIVVADRKKNMLISGGINIYPAEIERALMQIPYLREVVVLGLPSERWGQEVVAIAYAPGHGDEASIVSDGRAILGSVKAPKRVILSPDPLPRTASNKIVRTGLAELFARLTTLAA